MTAPIPTTYELLARFAKATALADALDASGVTAEKASGMIKEEWIMAATAARVKDPSETTRKLVIEMLESREAARRKVRIHAV